jgi:hypothetical protein
MINLTMNIKIVLKFLSSFSKYFRSDIQGINFQLGTKTQILLRAKDLLF